MRIVITGASGNVGTAVLRRLSLDGDRPELVGVCRRPPSDGEPYCRASWVSLDLARPGAAAELRPVLRGATAVVHLAWGFQPSQNVGYLDRSGVGGTRAVVDAAQAEGVPHLVHLSSVGAYSPGPGTRPVSEDWPTGGIDTLPYSQEKVAAERVAGRPRASSPRRRRGRPDAPRTDRAT